MTNVKIRGNQNLGLWSATMGFFFGMAAVSLFGPTAHKFKEVMHLDPTTVGFLVAIPSLSGSILRIPFGAWVDTTGGKKPFNILMILAVIGVAGLMWVTNTYYPHNMEGKFPLILLFGLLAGCGVATFSVGISQASYWFPQKKQGYSSGVYGGVGTLAPGLFAMLLPILIVSSGLGMSYVYWTFFLLIGTVLYIIFGRNAPFFQYRKAGLSVEDSENASRSLGQDIFPKGGIKQSLIDSAKIPATWVLTSLYFCTFGGFLALTEWYPSFWGNFYEIKAVEAGILTAVFSMLSAALRIVAGPVADRIGGRKLCVGSMVLMIVSAGIMIISRNFYLSIACTLGIAVAMGFNDTAVFKMVAKFIPNNVGGASGWVGGIGAFGGFAVPPIMGAIATSMGKEGYAVGFVVFVVLAAFNLFVLWISKKKMDDAANGTPAPAGAPAPKIAPITEPTVEPKLDDAIEE